MLVAMRALRCGGKFRRMSFGKNPYVAKAQMAEQKAQAAGDRGSRQRSHREAAHQWDRAVEREKPGKQRDQFMENATRNRELADAVESAEGEASEGAESVDAPAPGPAVPPKWTLVK